MKRVNRRNKNDVIVEGKSGSPVECYWNGAITLQVIILGINYCYILFLTKLPIFELKTLVYLAVAQSIIALVFQRKWYWKLLAAIPLVSIIVSIGLGIYEFNNSRARKNDYIVIDNIKFNIKKRL